MLDERKKKRIREIIEEARRAGVTAGVNILVVENGEEVFFDALGYANRESREPLRRDHIFRLFSMTKPITAAAAMILLERGALDLATPVKDIIPGYGEDFLLREGRLVPSPTPVTVLHLLNMTSGLVYASEESLAGQKTGELFQECRRRRLEGQPLSTVEFAAAIGRLPLLFEPDTSWCYGLSADVLGAVIECVSGQRLGDFMQENLFDPLGMKDTGFWVPAQKQARLADAYGTQADGAMAPYRGDNLEIIYDMKTRPAYEAGGAGLVSTIDDYARFARMLLQGGELLGVRVMAPQTAAFLTSGDLTPPQQAAMRRWTGLEGFTYSHLMRRMINPGQASSLALPGEYGWDGWLGCYFANFPTRNMTLLLLQQKFESGTIAMTRKIRNVLLAE